MPAEEMEALPLPGEVDFICGALGIGCVVGLLVGVVGWGLVAGAPNQHEPLPCPALCPLLSNPLPQAECPNSPPAPPSPLRQAARPARATAA